LVYKTSYYITGPIPLLAEGVVPLWRQRGSAKNKQKHLGAILIKREFWAGEKVALPRQLLRSRHPFQGNGKYCG
jgi:hypothetical protein